MGHHEIPSSNDQIQRGSFVQGELSGFLKFIFNDLGLDSRAHQIDSYETLLNLIIEKYKAKRYIGVGVGCWLVNEEKDKVLLYKRYKDPEKNKWSMPGGGAKYGHSVQEIAELEFKNITKINLDHYNDKKDYSINVLRITNHYPPDPYKPNGRVEFHYVSPAFYIDIKEGGRLREDLEKRYPCDGHQPFTVPYEDEKKERDGQGSYQLKWFDIKSLTPEEITITTYAANRAFLEYKTSLDQYTHITKSLNGLNDEFEHYKESYERIFRDMKND
jgi:8-oxo-dGTP pyrophosphatase MutT (NUDIX family)